MAKNAKQQPTLAELETIPAAAKRITKGDQTIRDWIIEGLLPLYTSRCGRVRCVLPADVDRVAAMDRPPGRKPGRKPAKV